MVAKPFTKKEWKRIDRELDRDRKRYGFPERTNGSLLFGSFNIRKLGSVKNRNLNTWNFLAEICKQYDLLAIQEAQDNLEGLRKLMELLGEEFHLIVSDITGVFPGERGVAERLAFVYRWKVVNRMEVVSDVTYDRTKILDTLGRNILEFTPIMQKYLKSLEAIDTWESSGREGARPKRAKMKLPAFLAFIRQPFCVSFRVPSFGEGRPYEFMAVNAHLNFGNFISDRRQAFDALMEWILARVKQSHRAYYSDFILLADLNLDFDNPEKDIPRISKHLKTFNNKTGEQVVVNFPFLDAHKGQPNVFRTTPRQKETYDQIGLFARDKRFPEFSENQRMGSDPDGPDYGMFNFADLFSVALTGRELKTLKSSGRGSPRAKFIARFEHKVSDHMPIWLRLPMP